MAVPQSFTATAPDSAGRARPNRWKATGRALLIATLVVVGGEMFGYGLMTWAVRFGLDGDLLLLKVAQPAVVALYQLALICAAANWLGGRRRRLAIVAAGPARLSVAGWIGAIGGLYALKAAATITFVWLAGGPPAPTEAGSVPTALAPFGALMRSHVWMWLVLAGIVAAIVEELVWRGWVSRTLERSPLGFWLGAIVASVLWAALHLYYPWTIQATLVVIGVALSWLRAKTGSIWPGAVWHVLNNVVALIALRFLV